MIQNQRAVDVAIVLGCFIVFFLGVGMTGYFPRFCLHIGDIRSHHVMSRHVTSHQVTHSIKTLIKFYMFYDDNICAVHLTPLILS